VKIIFWVAVFLVVYTYFGYPCVLWAVARITPRRVLKKEIFPSVSIVIAARNEADKIRQKIDHTLALDYPTERLEILVASDASDDRTDEIVKEQVAAEVAKFQAEAARTAASSTPAPAPAAQAKAEDVKFEDGQLHILKKLGIDPKRAAEITKDTTYDGVLISGPGGIH